MTGSGWKNDGEIEHHLSDLMGRTDVLTALLLKLDGTCMAVAGDTAQVNTSVLAVLIAEMVSCGRAVARVVGEDRFSTVLQLGENRHVHVALVGDSHVLVVVFEEDREAGLVRLQARRTAERLAEILRPLPGDENEGEGAATQTFVPRRIDPIDRIFGTHTRKEKDPHSP
jgi:predicted regulator of Ras-like GTPase activity (Roadblock/LC7/MglB family)